MYIKLIMQFVFIFLIFACLNVNAVFGQTAAFSYQGRLTESGSPVTGTRYFRFTLYDENGVAIPNASVEQTLMVTNGIFNTSLNFGVAAFPGANRSLEIAVKINAGDAYTILNPRQEISSSPYSLRALNAQQANIALDSNRLGGLDASEYVTNSSVGSSFIRNSPAQQTANFNISGNGTLGGTLTANTVTAQTGTSFYGLTQTDGTTTVSTYIGGSMSGATGAWFGTQSNSPLHFFTNNSQSQMTILQNGNVGIGTANPQAKLDLNGNAAQDRTSGGMVKALLSVDANGVILRCYNGVTGSSTGNCGFTVSAGSSGTYVVNLGFQVTDRFLSIVARGITLGIGLPIQPMSADYRFSTFPNANPNEVAIDTFRPDTGATANNPFMLIVY